MFHCSIIQRGSKQSRIRADIKKKIFVSCIHCFSREVSHSSSSAQPQSPGPNQWQFQHVKASKSMDLGTTQNQQPTGGERLLCLCSAWWLQWRLFLPDMESMACCTHAISAPPTCTD